MELKKLSTSRPPGFEQVRRYSDERLAVETAGGDLKNCTGMAGLTHRCLGLVDLHDRLCEFGQEMLGHRRSTRRPALARPFAGARQKDEGLDGIGLQRIYDVGLFHAWIISPRLA